MFKKMSPRKRKILIWSMVILLIIALIYCYTYFFARKHDKVIYQDAQRRIYLTSRKAYGTKGREMFRMVYEDLTTGKRFFVLGNAPKGYKDAELCRRVLNTMERGKTTEKGGKTSFDQVDRVGVTIVPAGTDVHSNLIGKKTAGDLLPEMPDLSVIENQMILADA